MCRIGQQNRCKVTGCEFLKVLGTHCIGQPISDPDMKYFYGKEVLKPAQVKKESKIKKTTIKKRILPEKSFKKEKSFIDKIGTAKQDDWIKKIKVIK